MSQAAINPRWRWALSPYWLLPIAGIVLVTLAFVFRGHWLPLAQGLFAKGGSPGAPGETSRGIAHAEEEADPHAGHDHAAHDAGSFVKLSEQARKNIGLKVAKTDLRTFTRTISLPGIVIERPGRSEVKVTAPLSGIVTQVFPTQGEAVSPGQKLFELRLTHEDLVQAQAELLRTAEELDVIGREIARIEKLTTDGALAGKTLLGHQYEQQRQQAIQRSQRQALLLHGLNDAQVDAILKSRVLLQSLTVVVPGPTDHMTDNDMSFYQVQEMNVSQGQFVNIGEALAVLTDHSQLFIEGNAFERDIPAISRAASDEVRIEALVDSDAGRPQSIGDLRVLYAAAKVDPESRTLHFYVTLPNTVESDMKLDDGRRFVSWRFRPGQRMQLQIPVETLPNRIVLPADAVAQDGAETYVFTPNGDKFERRTVHVEFKDQRTVVIANDGALFPGSGVAVSGAKQLQLQLKNQSGGAPDPHAGHNH